MTVVFSTSSPVASVALFSDSGRLLGSMFEQAPCAASEACLRMLEKLLAGLALGSIEMFAADTGPGSFMGVKVGVTLAKTLAFANAKMAAGVPAFDLISKEKTVVIPSRKGEWFVRALDSEPGRTCALPEGPLAGYGPGIESPRFPDASRADVHGLAAVRPEVLVPAYLAEPSISTPKSPYRTLASGAGAA